MTLTNQELQDRLEQLENLVHNAQIQVNSNFNERIEKVEYIVFDKAKQDYNERVRRLIAD